MSKLPTYTMAVVEEIDNGTCWVEVTVEGFEEPFWTERARYEAERTHALEVRAALVLGLEPPAPLDLPDDLPETRPIVYRVHVNQPRLGIEVRDFVATLVEQRDRERGADS